MAVYLGQNEVILRNGISTTDADATAADILAGKTAYVNDKKLIGTISSKSAATYTPSTTNQTITSGQYLSGAQTISGDADLIAANIKSGVNIFGVAGTFEGGDGGANLKTGTFVGNGTGHIAISAVGFTPIGLTIHGDLSAFDWADGSVDYNILATSQIGFGSSVTSSRVLYLPPAEPIANFDGTKEATYNNNTVTYNSTYGYIFADGETYQYAIW